MSIAVAIVGAIVLCISLSRPNPKTQLQGIANALDGSSYKFEGRVQRDTVHSVQYDVRKTDSVVSPYVGTIAFHLWQSDYDVTLAFQDGRWVLKSVDGFLSWAIRDHVDAIISQHYRGESARGVSPDEDFKSHYAERTARQQELRAAAAALESANREDSQWDTGEITQVLSIWLEMLEIINDLRPAMKRSPAFSAEVRASCEAAMSEERQQIVDKVSHVETMLRARGLQQ